MCIKAGLNTPSRRTKILIIIKRNLFIRLLLKSIKIWCRICCFSNPTARNRDGDNRGIGGRGMECWPGDHHMPTKHSSLLLAVISCYLIYNKVIVSSVKSILNICSPCNFISWFEWWCKMLFLYKFLFCFNVTLYK